MAELVVTYWRDIPAQVTIGRRREAVRRELPDRFAKAIDVCAMRIGAKDEDAYTAEWRKGEPIVVGDDREAEAERVVVELDQAYDAERLKRIIEAEGWDAR